MRIAISGYYGCGNSGDEAVLAGIKDSFQQRAGKQAELIVLSQNPQATSELHQIRAVDRMKLSEVRRTLHECDLLLSGGGSLLQDTTSARSLIYYLGVAQIAYSLRKPVMFYAQGIGPLHRKISRTLVRYIANRATCITVRDPQSEQLLADIGVTNAKIEITADPAFALQPATDLRIDEQWRKEGLSVNSSKPIIGIALRPWTSSPESLHIPYARLLIELERQTGAQVVLIAMQIPGDVDFAEKVAAQTQTPSNFPIIRAVHDPRIMLGLVGRMDAIVAMRLHTLIFAARTAVPPFALAYDPKVENLMKGLDCAESMAHWKDFQAEEIAVKVKGLLTNRAAHSQSLQQKSAEWEERALRNVDCAMNIFR